ncbi:hypothetical protein CMV30_02990 [Nibricoccus aquaticus]|uniref:Lipoprotein n=1 Tax=Nibricoccus aquaticus TaxID=2576891 RepID=A0A290Q9U0_9BACT|nr:hypothetical protein [Nibricoccus aquaticus]ATC62996.1 hypothetical protein CMV30_02910 [Nibricoccus aquaticus]ATC63012.1 hypothetical protein CMV30_02990 [Nibricoccus aquaticus]
MKPILLLLILLLVGAGCVGPFKKKAAWSPAEVTEWYQGTSIPATIHRGIGYQGTDESFHYFIARPIDFFVFIKIPRAQLQIEDVQPRQQSSSAGLGVYYWVDPLQGFRKKEPNQPVQRNASTGSVSNFESLARRG